MDTILSMQAELSLIAVFLLTLIVDVIFTAPDFKTAKPKTNRMQIFVCALMVLHIALNIVPTNTTAFGGMYHSNEISSVIKTVLSVGTLLVFMQSGSWLANRDTNIKAGEFYIITLSTLIGMHFMVSAGSFILFYVGLELASIPASCLIAFDKLRHHSSEAGTKFILNSMFSSGLLLYGLSLIYGTCGTTYFEDLPSVLVGTPVQILAMVFFFAGLGFKMSLVPFHMWTPDTYQGAPTPVSGYLSVISKGAAAFAMMSILTKVFCNMTADWNLTVSVVIIITITIANIFAILQTNLKRFMAYSSISQAGYIMLAVLAGNPQGMASLIYYIVVYVVANLAVFGVIGAVEMNMMKKKEDEAYAKVAHIQDYDEKEDAVMEILNRDDETPVERDTYNGLYKTNPKLTLVMTLALFSLAGIPPFAGFFSKFFVFASAFHAGHWAVVFVALVNTIISLYYYLLVVKAMYINPNENPVPTFRTPGMTRACLVLCLIGIVGFGLCSGIYEMINNVALLW